MKIKISKIIRIAGLQAMDSAEEYRHLAIKTPAMGHSGILKMQNTSLNKIL